MDPVNCSSPIAVESGGPGDVSSDPSFFLTSSMRFVHLPVISLDDAWSLAISALAASMSDRIFFISAFSASVSSSSFFSANLVLKDFVRSSILFWTAWILLMTSLILASGEEVKNRFWAMPRAFWAWAG